MNVNMGNNEWVYVVQVDSENKDVFTSDNPYSRVLKRSQNEDSKLLTMVEVDVVCSFLLKNLGVHTMPYYISFIRSSKIQEQFHSFMRKKHAMVTLFDRWFVNVPQRTYYYYDKTKQTGNFYLLRSSDITKNVPKTWITDDVYCLFESPYGRVKVYNLTPPAKHFVENPLQIDDKTRVKIANCSVAYSIFGHSKLGEPKRGRMFLDIHSDDLEIRETVLEEQFMRKQIIIKARVGGPLYDPEPIPRPTNFIPMKLYNLWKHYDGLRIHPYNDLLKNAQKNVIYNILLCSKKGLYDFHQSAKPVKVKLPMQAVSIIIKMLINYSDDNMCAGMFALHNKQIMCVRCKEKKTFEVIRYCPDCLKRII